MTDDLIRRWLLVGPTIESARRWALANDVPKGCGFYVDPVNPDSMAKFLSMKGAGTAVVYLGGALSNYRVDPYVRDHLELLVAKGATEIMDDGSGL